MVHARKPRFDQYTLSSKQVPTGSEIWIASRQMPGQVPRLDDLAGPEVEGFRERSDAYLASLSAQLGKDVRASNYGWLPLVNRRRASDEGPESRGALELAGIVVPGDKQYRLCGVLLYLPNGSASARNPSFFGPLFPPTGKPQWQFHTGDSMVDKNGSRPLRLTHRGIADLLNRSSTYAEIVDVHATG
jgi:hypothetical protein